MNSITFGALSEPNRFQIVELLREKPRPVGELVDVLHIRQPQVSKHLKVLTQVGIVTMRPNANQHIYALSPKIFLEIDSWLEKYRGLWDQRLDALEKVLDLEKKPSVRVK